MRTSVACVIDLPSLGGAPTPRVYSGARGESIIGHPGRACFARAGPGPGGQDCCCPAMPQCFGSTPVITTWMCSFAAPLDSASASVSALDHLRHGLLGDTTVVQLDLDRAASLVLLGSGAGPECYTCVTGALSSESVKDEAFEIRVVEGARSAVERYGWQRATLERIAREAGVSRMTLHRHGLGREEIFALLGNGLRGGHAGDRRARLRRRPPGFRAAPPGSRGGLCGDRAAPRLPPRARRGRRHAALPRRRALAGGLRLADRGRAPLRRRRRVVPAACPSPRRRRSSSTPRTGRIATSAARTAGRRRARVERSTCSCADSPRRGTSPAAERGSLITACGEARLLGSRDVSFRTWRSTGSTTS